MTDRPDPVPRPGPAARQLRDELRAAAAELREELVDATVEVLAEVASAADEIGDEVATVRRSLAVVWGIDDPPSRGPKATLRRDAIVEAAIELADADGIGAVSMRAIAKALDVGTMSLYRHVPGKDELLMLMIDRVNGESPLVGELPGTWREQLEAMAWGDWRLAHEHPWLMSVTAMMARPVAGPNGLAAYESALAAASRTGLPPREVVELVGAVTFLTAGAAKSSVDSVLAVRRTGVANQDWWSAQEAVLSEVFDAERYPVFAALAEQGAFDGDGEDGEPIDFESVFASGLAALLDGIEVRVTARRAAGGAES